ncbi:MAG TPA: nuclear transport factor 2 family protein [Streptosporangiaceae bacterium]|nr:nuclear transport factor 2 family protein [Streptosporangiaceae bacterium]
MGMVTQPRQAWAHVDKKISMRPLAAADWSPEAVAARLQIAEAFYRFGTGHDEARADVVGSCFTQDAVFEVARGQGEPFVHDQGRAQIIGRITAIVAEQADQRRHSITNVLVERLSSETASAIAYGQVSVAADGLTLGASVLYVADLVREADGCWRFSYFYIGMDDYAGDRPRSGEE